MEEELRKRGYDKEELYFAELNRELVRELHRKTKRQIVRQSGQRQREGRA